MAGALIAVTSVGGVGMVAGGLIAMRLRPDRLARLP